MALHGLTLDREQRVVELRADLRRARRRSATAEEELEHARSLFDGSLLRIEPDVHEMRARVEQLKEESRPRRSSPV